jgi:Ca2+-binding EF-hand superfamily protein
MVGKVGFSIFVVVFCLSSSIFANKDKLADEKHVNADGEHNAKYDHEAFVGEEEAKKYEKLSPAESKDRLSKLIPAIDKDSDGFLDKDELKNHIKYMQMRYVLKDVNRTWGHYEQEKFVDGKLPWDEYKKAVYGPEEAELSKEYKEMMDRDRRRWKNADKSKDDQLTLEEYTCFMHPETCDDMKDIIVAETVEDIDKNKDGVIDMEEYIRDLYRPEQHEKQEPDWVKSEREMFQKHRDKDGDGKLNKEEMREWITPTGFDHAEAEANHLTHLADDDKDGKLSKDEILNHYDVFVGSQATDYGDQLHKHDPSEL